jgi:acetyltransferase-like isoleucine patch superfamily enzyme
MKILNQLKNRLFHQIALNIPGSKSIRVWLHKMRGVTIGKNVFIGMQALIETEYPERIFLGNNVVVGIRSIIIGHFNNQTKKDSGYTVVIEDDVYISPGVIILPNITIGKGSVISAGSVVKTSIPPKSYVEGNPARIVAECGVPLTSSSGYSYIDFINNLRPLRIKRKTDKKI